MLEAIAESHGWDVKHTHNWTSRNIDSTINILLQVANHHPLALMNNNMATYCKYANLPKLRTRLHSLGKKDHHIQICNNFYVAFVVSRLNWVIVVVVHEAMTNSMCVRLLVLRSTVCMPLHIIVLPLREVSTPIEFTCPLFFLLVICLYLRM